MIYSDKFIFDNFGNPGLNFLRKAGAASVSAIAIKAGFSYIDTLENARVLEIQAQVAARVRTDALSSYIEACKSANIKVNPAIVGDISKSQLGIQPPKISLLTDLIARGVGYFSTRQ